MRTFKELIEEQEKIEGLWHFLRDLCGVDIAEVYRIAEKLQKEEYILIYFLHVKKGWGFAKIGRLLGKKRCVIRKKYINCLKILGEEGDNS